MGRCRDRQVDADEPHDVRDDDDDDGDADHADVEVEVEIGSASLMKLRPPASLSREFERWRQSSLTAPHPLDIPQPPRAVCSQLALRVQHF